MYLGALIMRTGLWGLLYTGTFKGLLFLTIPTPIFPLEGLQILCLPIAAVYIRRSYTVV